MRQADGGKAYQAKQSQAKPCESQTTDRRRKWSLFHKISQKDNK